MATERVAADYRQSIALEPDYETRPAIDRRVFIPIKRALKHRVQAALRWGFAQIGAATRESSEESRPLRAGDPHIRRILIVRIDLLGDVVLSTPAVRTLRRAYPEAAIDVLVQTPYAGVLEGDPDIHRVLTWNPQIWSAPRNWFKLATWREASEALKRMRSPRYDLALSVNGDIGSIVTRLSNARRRVGYAKEAYRDFMTDPVPGGRYSGRAHETSYVLRLAEAAGATSQPGDERPRLTVTLEAGARMRSVLDAARATLAIPNGPLIALHAGAQNGQAKRWPARHWAALAGRLATELGALVVLTGAPNEAPLAEKIAYAAGAPLLNLCGKTSLLELKALLAQADLVISGDSGPMHIACAVGAPVIALHGPTDPAISGPTAPDALILRHELWCSPCYDASETAECRFGNPVCMKDLAPNYVFAAARKQLVQRSHTSVDAIDTEPAEHGTA